MDGELELAEAFEELDPSDGNPGSENQTQGDEPTGAEGEPEIVIDDPENPEVQETEIVIDPETGEPIVDPEADPEQQQAGDLTDEHKVKVTIDGAEVEMTYGALKQAAQKAAGAEKRFAEAHQIRTDAEEKLKILPQREKELSQVLEYYINQSTEFLKANEPNWKELLENDPHEYLKAKERWELKVREDQQARGIQAELQRREAAEQQASQQRRAAEEKEKLFTVLPEWRDPVKADAGVREIDAYLESKGLTKEMRAQIDTAAVMLIARDAMLYHRALEKQKELRANGGRTSQQAQTQQVVRKTAPTARPVAGKVVSPQNPTRQSAQRRAAAETNFKKNPSTDGLASFFE